MIHFCSETIMLAMALAASANALATPVELAERAVTTQYLFSLYVLPNYSLTSMFNTSYSGDSYTATGFVPGGVQPACNNSMGPCKAS